MIPTSRNTVVTFHAIDRWRERAALYGDEGEKEILQALDYGQIVKEPILYLKAPKRYDVYVKIHLFKNEFVYLPCLFNGCKFVITTVLQDPFKLWT